MYALHSCAHGCTSVCFNGLGKSLRHSALIIRCLILLRLDLSLLPELRSKLAHQSNPPASTLYNVGVKVLA